jgi:hypothetical protein
VDRPDPFDPDRLRLPADAKGSPPKRAPARPPRHRTGEAFLKGPIPWPWITRAAKLRGQAIAVGLVLWLEAGCRKSRTVSFRLSAAAALGMHADTARRGLRALEAARLVNVASKPGRCLTVTILETTTTVDDREHGRDATDGA